MMTADSLRNDIIDKLLTISNKEYLSALYQLVDKSSVDNDIVNLTEEQIITLQFSDDDKHGRLVSQADLDHQDLEWLKGNNLELPLSAKGARYLNNGSTVMDLKLTSRN